MKRLLLPLLAAIALPTAVNAEPIPMISDWDASFDQSYRLDFECPYKQKRERIDGRYEIKKIPIYSECWVTFHKDYMEIMNRQKIFRKDLIKYWSGTRGYTGDGRSGIYHNFLYKDNNQKKLFSFRKRINMVTKTAKDYLENKYVKYYVQDNKKQKIADFDSQVDVIKHWMAQ